MKQWCKALNAFKFHSQWKLIVLFVISPANCFFLARLFLKNIWSFHISGRLPGCAFLNLPEIPLFVLVFFISKPMETQKLLPFISWRLLARNRSFGCFLKYAKKPRTTRSKNKGRSFEFLPQPLQWKQLVFIVYRLYALFNRRHKDVSYYNVEASFCLPSVSFFLLAFQHFLPVFSLLFARSM